jgi:hypothetical protein
VIDKLGNLKKWMSWPIPDLLHLLKNARARLALGQLAYSGKSKQTITAESVTQHLVSQNIGDNADTKTSRFAERSLGAGGIQSQKYARSLASPRCHGSILLPPVCLAQYHDALRNLNDTDAGAITQLEPSWQVFGRNKLAR